MSQSKTRQQRRAEARAEARKHTNGGEPKQEILPSQEAPSQPPLPDGVWITTRSTAGENGQTRMDINIGCTGDTRATEIMTILLMAIRKHKQDNGLE